MYTNLEDLYEKHRIVSVSPLFKGWSRDKKFILEDRDGKKLLLRLSDSSLYDKKKKQFELLTRIEKLDLHCSRPIDFGTLEDERVFILLSYLDGVDGKTAVAAMDDGEAYSIGVEAGKVLRTLHNVEIPPQEQSWWKRYLEKMPRKIAALKQCEYTIPMQDKLLDYYSKNCEIMKERPLVLCHGDYHLGNMIVHNGKIGVIDFDKNGAADPYDDLKPFCWNVTVSEYFETGLINGYFDGDIPEDFWTILKYYTAESLISHLPWAATFGEEEIKTAMEIANCQMIWYDDFKLTVPTWYKG